MNKLQASMRDAAARRWREAKHYYKVGGAFKGCHSCGDYRLEVVGRRERKVYSTGFDVFRSYSPRWTKWTYKCFTCGATDAAAWEDAADIGEEPILGNRDVIKMKKGQEQYVSGLYDVMWRDGTKLGESSPRRESPGDERAERIAALERRVRELQEQLGK